MTQLGQGANRSALAQRSPDASLDNRREGTTRSEFAAGLTPCMEFVAHRLLQLALIFCGVTLAVVLLAQIAELLR